MIRRFAGLAALACAAALLQGCFPAAVVATGAAAVVATDRRTPGIYVEDETIEWKALGKLREPRFNDVHVNVTSFNRRVLLTGEAPNEELRRAAEEAVRGISNVREVQNEVRIQGASSLASRGNDALITSNVKARMVNNGRFHPNHVKVVTEAGTVFLMGLVTQAEGDAAAQIARTTSGVGRVVKVFEYIG